MNLQFGSVVILEHPMIINSYAKLPLNFEHSYLTYGAIRAFGIKFSYCMSTLSPYPVIIRLSIALVKKTLKDIS